MHINEEEEIKNSIGKLNSIITIQTKPAFVIALLYNYAEQPL